MMRQPIARTAPGFTIGRREPVEGLAQLQAKLDHFAKTYGTAPIAVAGLRGMQVPLKKGLRREVNKTQAPASAKRAVRATVGSRVKKVRGDYQLKVGFGVGKATKSQGEKATARARSSRPGVGISKQNIHWVILGTGKHSKKTRQHRRKKKSGASTGSTAPMMLGMVKAAIRSMGAEAVRAAAGKAKLTLQKEARKRR